MKLTRHASALLLAFAALFASGAAHALSVDCAKIANPDENTICSEVELAKLDNEMSNNYKLVNANLPLRTRGYLKASQDAWWTSPDSPRSGNCKGDLACIKAKYVARAAYMSNPNFRYEGIYVGKGSRLSVQSFGNGALRVGFLASDSSNSILGFEQSRSLQVVDRVLVLPPPAGNCDFRIEFGEAAATVHLKEAKKKACDGVKNLAGQYARDFNAVPGK